MKKPPDHVTASARVARARRAPVTPSLVSSSDVKCTYGPSTTSTAAVDRSAAHGRKVTYDYGGPCSTTKEEVAAPVARHLCVTLNATPCYSNHHNDSHYYARLVSASVYSHHVGPALPRSPAFLDSVPHASRRTIYPDLHHPVLSHHLHLSRSWTCRV
jgi:hypothetical protein